ncbi:hypothetical protein GA0115237_101288 [Streptomyces sp. ScaeMP-6W]|nr:hypothetical protein GA0115237_101288 [Streptomyces sp. ScaeMP-6W]
MAGAPLLPAGLGGPVRDGLKRRPGCLCGRSPAPRHRFKTASIAGRARNVASNAGRAGMWLRPRSCLRASAAPSGTASSAGRAGVWCGWAPPLRARRDPGGHRLASSAGRAGKDGLKRRPGCGVLGAFAVWVGRGRTGVPPHKLQGAGSIGARRPSVQFAAGAPRHDPALPSRRRRPAGGWGKDMPSPVVLCGERKYSRWSLWRGRVLVTALSALRRLAAYETVGWGRVGVPPQQTAHTAALKRLTPHPAVCEEVPRHGPAPPTHRRNREPDSPAGV